jgi:molybdate transport system ATP-binding protein
MSADRAPTLKVSVKLARKASEKGSAGFSLDVAFDASPGVTVLFGPSGAGKSTVLAAIAGLLRPDAGRIALGPDVWFDGATGAERPVHLRKIAYVFQSLALFPHMTARKNVEYGIDRSVPESARKELALQSLERFRAAHVESRKPRTFSGGEAQRVALARAFAMKPRVVLLDEPFSAMDRELRRELAVDVRRFAGDLQVPILLVTHHRNEARVMGDRALLISHGTVKQRGAVDDVLPAERGANGDEL